MAVSTQGTPVPVSFSLVNPLTPTNDALLAGSCLPNDAMRAKEDGGEMSHAAHRQMGMARAAVDAESMGGAAKSKEDRRFCDLVAHLIQLADEGGLVINPKASKAARNNACSFWMWLAAQAAGATA